MADPELGTTQPLLPQPDGPASLTGNVEHWSRGYARHCYALLSNVALSIFFGALAGFGFKTIGESLAIALVLLFIGFQVLAYHGFVHFNWRHVGAAVIGRFDVNRDGKVDLRDMRILCTDIGTWALSWGIPSVLGFCLGFWVGWRVL